LGPETRWTRKLCSARTARRPGFRVGSAERTPRYFYDQSSRRPGGLGFGSGNDYIAKPADRPDCLRDAVQCGLPSLAPRLTLRISASDVGTPLHCVTAWRLRPGRITTCRCGRCWIALRGSTLCAWNCGKRGAQPIRWCLVRLITGPRRTFPAFSGLQALFIAGNCYTAWQPMFSLRNLEETRFVWDFCVSC
jgi:hypothetical protein